MSLDILSSNLQRLRHAQGLSQDRLALAAGISRIAYINIERRKTSLGPRLFVRWQRRCTSVSQNC